MLVLNKYLKELGLNEESFPFKKEDKRYYPDKDGFVEADYFDLSSTMAKEIYSHLCYFREYTQKFGHPAHMTMDKWLEILDKMIYAFKLIITEDVWNLSKHQIKDIKFGLRLYTKYFFDLWT